MSEGRQSGNNPVKVWEEVVVELRPEITPLLSFGDTINSRLREQIEMLMVKAARNAVVRQASKVVR